MSLQAARGDGARLCPPKAQPTPPPRDLVQRSFELCALIFVLCSLLCFSQSTKYQVLSTKYQVSRSLLRLLPCKDRRAGELGTCRAPKLPGRSDSLRRQRHPKLPHFFEATDESTGAPVRRVWL